MEAYCVKCKTKRELQNPQAVFTETGTPATRGTCPVCGTTLFRMGATPAHEGLPKPAVTPRRRTRKTAKKGKGQAETAWRPRGNNRLVIVESPAKARTVGRFLGNDYRVKASLGHVRDLLKSQLSVDVENDFEPRYRVPKEKTAVVKELKEEVKRAKEVFLATDPDREGEAIAWHLMEAAAIAPEQARRVEFHEITRPAIEHAFAHPRALNMNLIDAQQARRILDRLVGYKISPLLWEKVRGRLSAGRVQSVAVRLIVEREREIDAFVPQEYWTIQAELAKQNGHNEDRRSFFARLHKIRGQDVNLKTEAETMAVVDELEKSNYVVADVKRGERRRKPSAPFTTSTLQQESSRRLGFTAKRTMAVAQQLYEGVEVDKGQGAVGLITYMRTDSTNVAEQAQKEAREYVSDRYGKSFLPAEPPQYKTRAKGAQEAHEAIRPTSVLREPNALRDNLNRDQYRLYTLIWQRFLASQMTAAVYDTLSIDIMAGMNGAKVKDYPYLFRAAGSTLKFPGFLVVYEEARDEDVAPPEEEQEAKLIPELSVDEVLDLLRLLPEQHFTQPPPRFSEATLVKALEEYGIGRPSTYAPIMSTIQDRGYVERVDRRLIPTDTGMIVNDLLVQYFPDIVDMNFTAHMEADLDKIALGDMRWVPVIREFYGPFEKQLVHAEATMPKQEGMANQPIGRDCPDCGQPLLLRWGRFGKFIGCTGFPNCRHTEPFLVAIGVRCPKDGGEIVERKTRKKRIFYGCANYPACDFTSWKRPIPQPCPNCGGLLVIANKQNAQCIQCEQFTALDDLPELEAVAA
jgi:DNA topoisomerase-1